MSDSLPSERASRDWASFFVRPRGSGSVLHLPAPDATPEDPKPLCGDVLDVDRAEWTSKPVEVYPVGFAPICKVCRRELARHRSEVGEVD